MPGYIVFSLPYREGARGGYNTASWLKFIILKIFPIFTA
jgi:hypothetical protein